MTSVCNISKKVLVQNGYKDFEDWISKENHVYIGRNMDFYVKGAKGSKWQNPFGVKKYGRDKCIEMYENYIRNEPTLFDQLSELEGKTLGCWCHPEPCHGDVLVKLLKEKCNE